MFPFLIIAYSTTNGPAPSEAAGPAPMAPNRWARKKWINSASLIAAPWGLLLAFSGLRWKLFEHLCHAPIEVLFILRCTIRERAFGATPPN
jgi:hypothetical protein